MRTSRVFGGAVAVFVAAASYWLGSGPAPERLAAPPANAEETRLLSRLPISFVPNLGQWSHPAQFVARIGTMTVFLEETGWSFTLVECGEKCMPPLPSRHQARAPADAPARGVAVRMTLVGARRIALLAEGQLPGHHNYMLGSDPSSWRSDVPLYASVRYREIHSGIDVRVREQDGHFEYDLLLQPHADLEAVEIGVEGIETLQLDTAGALVMRTRLGPVRMPAPVSWQVGASGERDPITCRYVLRGNDRFGFEVRCRRPDWSLVVDPGIVWSTFLGGAIQDYANALALDSNSAVTVAGDTASIDFPTTPGAFDTSLNAAFDVFVTQLSPTGSSLVYSTFLGGADTDRAFALALDSEGVANVAGYTGSIDFPTTPGAFDRSYNGGVLDTFFARLSPTGSVLAYSTYLGGIGDDRAVALALDGNRGATVAGWTGSVDFPTTPGAFDTSYNAGGSDCFVSRFSPTGASLVYSTFLGAGGGDTAEAVAVDALGAATVAGYTDSGAFPTTPGAFDRSYNGGVPIPGDAFVARLSPTGSTLVYSTFLGGSGADTAKALALDAAGAATVAGATWSSDFPITFGAFDTTHNGFFDGFVTRLSPTGSSLVFSTFLGGTDTDFANALAIDTAQAVTVTGFTLSHNYPTTQGAFDSSWNGRYDVFVTRLSPLGSRVVYSTLLGGTADDVAQCVVGDPQAGATVAGWTCSTNFPTTAGAFDTTHNGDCDAFVTRIDMLPTGVATFGRSTPGCAGLLAISVTSMPGIGNRAFTLTCTNAPPNASGLLAVTANRLATGFIVLGAELWLDPSPVFVPLSAGSNQLGASEVPLPIPNSLALPGARLFAQFFWAGPAFPLPCPPHGLSASNALDITIQR